MEKNSFGLYFSSSDEGVLRLNFAKDRRSRPEYNHAERKGGSQGLQEWLGYRFNCLYLPTWGNVDFESPKVKTKKSEQKRNKRANKGNQVATLKKYRESLT